jgi:hypothetical protein
VKLNLVLSENLCFQELLLEEEEASSIVAHSWVSSRNTENDIYRQKSRNGLRREFKGEFISKGKS